MTAEVSPGASPHPNPTPRGGGARVGIWGKRGRGRLADVVSAWLAIAAVCGWTAMQAAAPDDARGREAAAASAATAAGHDARQARETVAPRARETVLGFYGGVPYTYPSDVTIKKTGVHDFTMRDVQWEGKPFTNPIYYGVRTTRWLSERSGAMLDFTHSKAISLRDVEHGIEGTLKGQPAPARGTVDQHFGKLEASHGHNMLTFNGLLRLPGFGRFAPYAGLGAGVSLPHMEVDIKGEPRTYEYQYAGPVGQALAGIEIRLPRVSLFLEYKFTLAPYDAPLTGTTSRDFLPQDLWRQFSAWLSGGEPPEGRLTTTFTSHQVIGGVAVRLAPAASAAP
jgi:lipid A oxidase